MMKQSKSYIKACKDGMMFCLRHPKPMYGISCYRDLHCHSRKCDDLSSLSRQMNMDYSGLMALHHFSPHSQALIIYDICCEWSIHFQERVMFYKFFELKWHLAAHIIDCFHKFSLNFVEGARQVGGEILETLWSVLNNVAGISVR